MRRNRKGQSAGFAWIYGLVTLFGLGVLYIVFSQVFSAYLIPVIKNQVAATTVDEATKLEIYGNIDRYMVYFNILPIVLVLVVVIYMFYAGVRKEGDQSQY